MMRVHEDLSSVAAPDATGGRQDDLLSTAQQHASMRVPVTSESERVAEVLGRL